jgi:SH3-like domain-containing protein
LLIGRNKQPDSVVRRARFHRVLRAFGRNRVSPSSSAGFLLPEGAPKTRIDGVPVQERESMPPMRAKAGHIFTIIRSCALALAVGTFGTAVHSLAISHPSAAQNVAAVGPATGQIGTATGLPVPRYVSLKSDRVNLREGPSKDHRTNWVFQRAGLPVEITAEFETWRKIRDSEGSEGWVLHSLLSGRRTALVFPSRKAEAIELLARPGNRAGAVARLQAGVIGSVRACDGVWCRLSGEGFDGYVEQQNLWGVYPGEKFD